MLNYTKSKYGEYDTDHYEVLKIDRKLVDGIQGDEEKQEYITNSYTKLAVVHSLNRYRGDNNTIENAEKELKKLEVSHEILIDPKKRELCNLALDITKLNVLKKSLQKSLDKDLSSASKAQINNNIKEIEKDLGKLEKEFDTKMDEQKKGKKNRQQAGHSHGRMDNNDYAASSRRGSNLTNHSAMNNHAATNHSVSNNHSVSSGRGSNLTNHVSTNHTGNNHAATNHSTVNNHAATNHSASNNNAAHQPSTKLQGAIPKKGTLSSDSKHNR